MTGPSYCEIISCSAGAAQQVRYISVSMQTREHRGFSAAYGFHGPCKSIYINVSPGTIISNLSPYTLYVMPSTAKADTQPLCIAAGSMQSLMCSWQGHQVDQHALLVSLSPTLRGCSEPQNSTQHEQHEADSDERIHTAAPSFIDSFARFLEEAAGVDQKQQAAPALQEATVTTSHQWRLPLFQTTGARTHAHLRDDYDRVSWLHKFNKIKSGIVMKSIVIKEGFTSLNLLLCRTACLPAEYCPRVVGFILSSL